MAGVTETWAGIAGWLARHAPLTAALIRPPAAPAAIDAIERDLGTPVPRELAQWWRAMDGLEYGAVVSLVPELYAPVPTGEVPGIRREQRELAEAFDADPTAAGSAGEPAPVYLDAFVPVAVDHCGQILFCDLRPGPARGCLTEWDHEQGALRAPVWPDVATMLTDLARALTTGTRSGNGYRPSVTPDGELEWLS